MTTLSLSSLPAEVQEHIREYASDRVTCRAHEAALISALSFRTRTSQFYKGTAVVETPPGVHFIRRSWDPWRRTRASLRMLPLEDPWDEHDFPQHFGLIGIYETWPTLREQDETEAMGAEDTRLYPEGCTEPL